MGTPCTSSLVEPWDAILAFIYYIFCGRENGHSICGSIGPSQGTSDERFNVDTNIPKVRLNWAIFSGLASGWVAWKGNEASKGTQCDATFHVPVEAIVAMISGDEGSDPAGIQGKT